MTEEEPDRLAIAQQVIKSAGDVLRAAGFDREEIGSFFRQAADTLSGAITAPSSGPSSASLAERLAAQFAQTPSGREIAQLSTQALRLGPPQGEVPLAGHFDLAMKMIPLIAEAQNRLRGVASEARLQVFADRRSAGDAANALCFDEFRSLWSEGFDLIAALLAALAERGDEEAFSFLLESLLENGVVISFELKETIEHSAKTLSAGAGGRANSMS